ncbi:MAG: 6-bladed beta-propeller [Gemmatimonadota bacterium]
MPRSRLIEAVSIVPAILLWATGLPAQDTIVVRADNPPVWGENLQLIAEVRIGQLDGPEEYLFGQVDAVAVDSNGTIFVADGQGPIIRRYRADGQFIGNVGGGGAGPGEYFQILGMRVLSSGELAIWDPRNLRVSVFDSSGTYARSVRVTSGLYTSNPFQVDTAGHFYVKGSAGSGRPTAGGDLQTVWIHVSPGGEIVDSIPIPLDHPAATSYVLVTPTGRRRPFTESKVSALSPHGYLVVGWNIDYTLNRPLRDGRVLRIERAFQPVPLEPDERAQWEAWSDHFENSEVFVEMRSGNPRHYPPIPSHKPAYRDFWVDQAGRIWVNLYVEAEFRSHTQEEPANREDRPRPRYEWREPPVWDVIDPRGTFLGSVRTPENGWIAVARGQYIWVVERGEFDEESVVRYRIEGG